MINTIVSYCTNDAKFLEPCVASATQFSNNVIVVYGETFYDGTPEDPVQLEADMLRCPDATFIPAPYRESMDPSWHRNAARAEGVKYLSRRGNNSAYTLLLDVDEIVEVDKFEAWWESQTDRKDVYELDCYWYFRDPAFQATKTSRAGLLIRTELLPHANLYGPDGRWTMPLGLASHVQCGVVGLDSLPMVHHYSWVRTEEEMLRKVTTLGYDKDTEWEPLIRASFEKDFSIKDRDFVNNYHYMMTVPYIEWCGVNNY
jgi:hypothetical protein